MNDKICPLMSFRFALSPEQVSDEFVTCKEDECAWYDCIKNQCSLLTIAFELEKTRESLETQITKS